jgi:hypothetical protein
MAHNKKTAPQSPPPLHIPRSALGPLLRNNGGVIHSFSFNADCLFSAWMDTTVPVFSAPDFSVTGFKPQ